MSDNLIKELYDSSSKERNEKLYGVMDTDQCICCMRPLQGNENKSVHMNTNWMAVHKDIDETLCEELTGAESQGSFPIGNYCAKKMGSGFISNL